MSWFNKEKELTLEESIEKAKKDLLPYWIKSDPLVAGMKDTSGVIKVHSLDRQFSEQPWLIYFFDLSKISSDNVFILSREWEKRFKQFGLNTLFVVRESYGFFRNKYLIRQSLDRNRISQITALDHESLLQKAFQVQDFPVLVLFHKGQTVFIESIKSYSPAIELKIHAFLRLSDPGLPLYPPLDPQSVFAQESYSVEFGKGKGCEFLRARPESGPLEQQQVVLKGKWVFDGDCVSTADVKAEIIFYAHTEHVAVFSRSLSRVDEPTRINFLSEDMPMFDMFFGKDMSFVEGNHSMVVVKEGRLYSALQSLPKDKRWVTLRFPVARKAPIAIYSLCFSGVLSP
jgi:hypothetical protein